MRRALAYLVASAFVLTGCATATPPAPRQAPNPHPTTTTPAYRDGTRPAKIEIPSIGASSTLVPVGTEPDGSLQVPDVHHPKQAAWYEPGPEPGQPGPAVIVGHVDGDHIEGVFWQLKVVKPGDKIDVTLVDGRRLTFTVYAAQVAPKSAFPAQRVFGYAPAPELRLVTCGGALDRAAHSYESNVIVYARQS